MQEFTNKEKFSIKIYILSNSDKNVLKFKWLFYAQGTEVTSPHCDDCLQQEIEDKKSIRVHTSMFTIVYLIC
jgi:hypothetical protein